MVESSMQTFKCLMKILFAVALSLFLSSCASEPPEANFGASINKKFHIGMTNEEVSVVVNDLKANEKHFMGSGFSSRSGYSTVGSPCNTSKYLCDGDPDKYLFMLYMDEQYPYDVLRKVTNETQYRYIEYAYAAQLYLFFDENTKLLRGWVNNRGYSRHEFMHERLTSKLKLEYGVVSHMSKDEVHALIGFPTETIDAPKKLSREILEDHYWNSATYFPPTLGSADNWEIYEYALETGAKRRVYLIYAHGHNKLIAFGYDHATEEAERYLQELAKTRR